METVLIFSGFKAICRYFDLRLCAKTASKLLLFNYNTTNSVCLEHKDTEFSCSPKQNSNFDIISVYIICIMSNFQKEDSQ